MSATRELGHEVGFVATAEDAGRVDQALARRYPTAGRKRLAALFERGAVRVDGRRAKKGDRLAAGARVELAEAPDTREDLAVVADAEAAERLAVLWRGPDALAVNKPAGMPSQPLRARELGTAANGIVAIEPACATASEDARDGGLVHRLDAGTSGVLLAATTRDAWRRLRAAFTGERVSKTYLALVSARPSRARTDAALSQRGNRVVIDEADGLAASTEITVLRSSATHHLVQCTARTGRMHQVRAHLAHLGAPIIGDTLYGGLPPLPGVISFFLHAAEIVVEGEGIEVTAPLPPDRAALLASLDLA
jgi:23S rRNA pseudouridine1911/1915/1917 synthase